MKYDEEIASKVRCDKNARSARSKEKYRKTVNIISNYETSGIVITTLNYAPAEFSLECIPVDQSRERRLT